MLLTAVLTLGIAACGGALDTASQPGSNPQGVPLPTETFRQKADGKTIFESGSPVPITRDAATGYVDNVIPEGRFIGLTGWAASADLTGPADAVVGFVGKKAVAALKPTGERPDVAEAYDNSALKGSGFVLRIPARSLDCAVRAEGLGVFGVAGGAATPLQWLGNVGMDVANACRQDRASRRR